ncbi:MAG: hypothetical protein ABSA05_08065 [Opitutaceae bacterium]|jgi:anti-sigma factor RsiW
MSTNENRISPDDPRLTAFALGELEGAELAKMEAELRADPAAQAIVAQIRVAAEQFQAVLAGETVEAAASVEGGAQPSLRESRSRFRRFLLWGLPLAACLAVLLVHEGFRRQAHEPKIVATLSRPIAETAAKVPAPAAIFDRARVVDVLASPRSPAGEAQPEIGEKAADQSRVESPAPRAQSEVVTLSPFEVGAAKAQGTFTPNTTTGTRLANSIGDIPSSVTVVDKQQLENTSAQKVNYITPPMPAAASPAPSPRIRPYIQPPNSLMFGRGRSANSNGQPSTDSDHSGLVAPEPVPVNPASIQSQIDSGASFGELKADPEGFDQAVFGDAETK